LSSAMGERTGRLFMAMRVHLEPSANIITVIVLNRFLF